MSIILANFGKYAISDCPFINDVDIVIQSQNVFLNTSKF